MAGWGETLWAYSWPKQDFLSTEVVLPSGGRKVDGPVTDMARATACTPLPSYPPREEIKTNVTAGVLFYALFLIVFCPVSWNMGFQKHPSASLKLGPPGRRAVLNVIDYTVDSNNVVNVMGFRVSRINYITVIRRHRYPLALSVQLPATSFCGSLP